LSSPQFAAVDQVQSEDGTPFLLANGPGLPAGQTLTFQLANLPAHSRTPELVALGLALAIVGLGAWLAYTARTAEPDVRRRLTARRDTLLNELAALEERRRKGAAVDAKRQRLVEELERLYGELDEAGVGPRGGGEGIAA
jgi:hypothetical protein